jgi:hypothetical protein
MVTPDDLMAWAQSFGVGGAFLVLALAALGVCALALRVALAALKRGKS